MFLKFFFSLNFMLLHRSWYFAKMYSCEKKECEEKITIHLSINIYKYLHFMPEKNTKYEKDKQTISFCSALHSKWIESLYISNFKCLSWVLLNHEINKKKSIFADDASQFCFKIIFPSLSLDSISFGWDISETGECWWINHIRWSQEW